MNTSKNESSRLPELFRLLDAMRNLYEQLNETVRTKLHAMRKADIAEIQAALERERTLVARLVEREGLRKQLMDLIGKEVGLDPATGTKPPANANAAPVLAGRAGRTLTVSQLAQLLSPMRASELKSRADALRKTVAEVAQANRVCDLTTRSLLHHLQWVFASVRPQSDPPIVYSGLGGTVTHSATRLVDIVG
jgi:flagellar biosynthesis/type III secretory pathway chaperone